ncbi:MAG: hypothetical protein P1V97_34605 [Planctomycetota bacterium]|nr:hypothetical protein [Planctomycetota bacterium]
MTYYSNTPSKNKSWIQEVMAEFTLIPVAWLLGLFVEERSNTIAPCPICGKEKREQGRNRLPIGLTKDLQGWRCHACKASGDVVSLVAAAMTGTTNPKDWRPVRSWFFGNVLQSEETAPRRQAPRAKRKPVFNHDHQHIKEAQLLWDRCEPILDHPRAACWLESRGFSVEEIARAEDLDLCRVIPLSGPLPKWARFGGYDWRTLLAVLVFPCFNSKGEVVSVRARLLGEDKRIPAGLKTLAPAQRGMATNSVLANDLGKLILKTGKIPEFYKQDAASQLEVVVVEGEPDFLSWALQFSDADLFAPVVFALWSGGWSQEIADRIPSRARVVARTDQGEAGDRYALEVYESVKERCDFFRWKGGRCD